MYVYGFFYRIFTLQDCGSWAGSPIKGYCQEYSGEVQVAGTQRTDKSMSMLVASGF